jgi:hypothetical protein
MDLAVTSPDDTEVRRTGERTGQLDEKLRVGGERRSVEHRRVERDAGVSQKVGITRERGTSGRPSPPLSDVRFG